MQTTKLYEGTAQGTRAQVAVRADERAFVRYWITTQWGPKWSKWAPFVATYPTFVQSKIEGYEHCSIAVEPRSRVSVGFADLPKVSDSARVRLPR